MAMGKVALRSETLTWLATYRDVLTRVYTKTLRALPTAFYRHLPEKQVEILANFNLNSLFQRLEGRIIDTEQLKQVFAKQIAQGIYQDDITQSIDQLLYTFTNLVESGQVVQPNLRQELIHKANYTTHILKTALALAVIENRR
jgi:hypothetical protein